MNRFARAACACAAALLIVAPSPGAVSPWEATVERVSRSVVALRVAATRAFDTEGASATVATGFVVDAERGLILTNRHVVHPGPVTADAVFLDHEEVPVEPVYRDPVHDFGFFRYDPEAIRFMEPVPLELAPQAARVGSEIRVIGNDAGEKLSILDGTLARLDRDAPEYGVGHYNDFNTFYLQAASSSSGGSSGSPVVDRKGRVIALNAGGSVRAASSFFLPLDRVVRALEKLQAGEPVTRGTLQTVFRLQAYDELRRLGLRPETEARVRARDGNSIGLLVVNEVVPGGPADGLLEPGDVVLGVDGRPLAGFAPLEAILDDAVGRSLSFEIERGGEPRVVDVMIQDLHEITPASYVEIGGGIVHPFSYQQARSYALPVKGLTVAAAGFSLNQAGIPRGALLDEIDGVPVPTLDALVAQLAAIPDGRKVRVRWRSPRAANNSRIGIAEWNRRWLPMRRCHRDDAHGRWDCVEIAAPPPGPPPAPATARLEASGPKPVRRVAHSLVLVGFEIPFGIDGVQGLGFAGSGLVVDAERGLVVVDRDTVPVPLGRVSITFGGSVEVPGRLVAFHPEHNLALVSYDPLLLGETDVRSAEFDAEPLRAGDDVWLVVMTARQQLLSRESQVERVDAPTIPIPQTPRFRESNLDVVTLADSVGGVGGVLADGKGRVRALWASFSADSGGKPSSFFAGIPADVVESFVEPLRAGLPLDWHSLGMELESLPVAAARARGLPEDLAEALEEHDPLRRRALSVRRTVFDSPAAALLRPGDLVTHVDGQPVTRFHPLERAAQAGRVGLSVVRGGERLDVDLPTERLDTHGTERVLIWAGAVLHAAPRALAAQRGQAATGVYVSGRFRGTPAERHRLVPTWRILAVDGVATPDLDAFLTAVAGLGDRASVRLRVMSLQGRVRVLTLDLDLHYWPTLELRRGPTGWDRVPAEAPASAASR